MINDARSSSFLGIPKEKCDLDESKSVESDSSKPGCVDKRGWKERGRSQKIKSDSDVGLITRAVSSSDLIGCKRVGAGGRERIPSSTVSEDDVETHVLDSKLHRQGAKKGKVFLKMFFALFL